MLLFRRSLATLAAAPPAGTVLRPGLTVVRRALGPAAQLDLARASCDLGMRDAPAGFFDESGRPNSRPYRSRIFSAVAKSWPRWVGPLCADAVAVARAADPTLPPHTATHVLLLAYLSDEGVGWHRDIYENDGEADSPVVTINLGNACDFIFKDDHLEPKTHLRLESGDALLFGGPQRYALHKVSHVHQDTCPGFLREPLDRVLREARRRAPDADSAASFGDTVRLSLTFRDAPGVLGRESEFATFKVDEHFDKDANYAWRAGRDNLVGAQPGQGTSNQGRRADKKR